MDTNIRKLAIRFQLLKVLLTVTTRIITLRLALILCSSYYYTDARSSANSVYFVTIQPARKILLGRAQLLVYFLL